MEHREAYDLLVQFVDDRLPRGPGEAITEAELALPNRTFDPPEVDPDDPVVWVAVQVAPLTPGTNAALGGGRVRSTGTVLCLVHVSEHWGDGPALSAVDAIYQALSNRRVPNAAGTDAVSLLATGHQRLGQQQGTKWLQYVTITPYRYDHAYANDRP